MTFFSIKFHLDPKMSRSQVLAQCCVNIKKKGSRLQTFTIEMKQLVVQNSAKVIYDQHFYIIQMCLFFMIFVFQSSAFEFI